MPRIKIEPIVKAQSKTENLWEVTHFLDAEEIFTAIEFISREHCAFSYLNVRAFLNPPNSSFEATFACKGLILTNSEFLQVLTQGANDGSLESFLQFQSAEILQNMLSTAGLASSSQNKEDLLTRPTTKAGRFSVHRRSRLLLPEGPARACWFFLS